ncbi:MAG: response regulator [Deltaproteobacteria bacterium]|nr:response regulator [Deltaproteobacteria bacterium]
MMGKTLEVSRVYIFEHRHETDTMDNTFEWCAPAITPQKDDLQKIPSSAVPWWMNMLKTGEIIKYSDIEDIPSEQEKEILRPQNIKSILVVPLYVQNKYYGFMGFDECRDNREWKAEDVEMMKTISQIIISTLERERAKKTLHFERQQLLSIFNSINEIIYIADPKTYKILYANSKLTDIVGKDVTGGLCYKEFQGLESPCGFCTNEKILQIKYEPYSWEHHNPILNRDYMIIDRVIKWPNGKDVRLEIAIDITARKQAEEEKLKLKARLHRAEKMESIGTLAGGVAHDLNNILSGIVSYPDLLLMQLPEDSPLKRPIQVMQDTGKKAAAIVQDLLTLARRGVVVTEVVNINNIVSEYLQSPERKKTQEYYPTVQWETNLETDLLNIVGSPIHLFKTIMNLVSNAAEAMPNGGRIMISTENKYIDQSMKGYDEIVEGDYVTLTVSDTGIGISPKEIEKIFEPFYTKKVMGRSGTGLGMAVVWGTVKDHDGYIDIQSEEGKGTTFKLYFPVTRKERALDKPTLSIREYMGKGESILIVDDVETQREIAFSFLSQLGYSVTKVSSGEEAVEYMKKTTAQLLILDMIMDPGMDGLDTYKQIIEIRPKQKAIIASGFSETERVKEALRLGAGRYIQKPYTLEKIGITVKEELQNE